MIRVQRVYEGMFLGRSAIIKQRFSKKYRHATLDTKLTQLRFKQVGSAICEAPWGKEGALDELFLQF
jgi:tRNA A-37 threonylcarbamoyl transferase component Bud32